MAKANWLPYLTKALEKKSVAHLAQLVSVSNSLKELLDLSFHQEPVIAFRAAWILEYTLMYSPGKFTSLLPDFLSSYPRQNNRSCQRHFTKILMYFTEKRQSIFLQNQQLEPVVETTFEWLIDPRTPVAVQVNCLTILFNLRNRYEWIGDELKAQIIFLLKNGSAAMQSRGKKLLKKLK